MFIRPLGDKPDAKMNQEDLALYRQLGAWAEELTGYPMVSGCEEFLYEPDTPLHGDLTDYAYHQRGAVAYVVELWDLFKQVGFERKKRFVDNYVQLTRGRHASDRRVGSRQERRAASCARGARSSIRSWATSKSAASIRASGCGIRRRKRCRRSARPGRALPAGGGARAGRGARRGRDRERSSPELTRITVTVANHGYLPTYILASAKALTHNEPLWADVRCTGCELADPDLAHREIGHLDGWGRGLFDGSGALYYTRTRGTTGARTLSWVVRGRGVRQPVASARAASDGRRATSRSADLADHLARYLLPSAARAD